jgi:hypothetical protein
MEKSDSIESNPAKVDIFIYVDFLFGNPGNNQ